MLELEELTETSQAYFLAKAYDIGATSLDTSNKNGAIIVDPNTSLIISEGVNNFAPGVTWTEARAEQRPAKYRYYEHAERGAVFSAARQGKSTNNAYMVCPWAACCDCARGIIMSGISTLYMHKQRMNMTPDRWKDDVNEALNMLMEAGVRLRYYDGPIAGEQTVVNGVLWRPIEDALYEPGNWAIGMDD